jgi:dephospho-CoA kinase
MKTIGLVGGVASGKSLAANMLVELGAGRLDADRAGHELLAHDSAVRTALLQRWGEDIFASDGSVNRAAVAERVFSGDKADEERRFLEGLLHPRIRRKLEAVAASYESNRRPAVVVDAPLLLEAGWGPMCDVVLMIDTPRDLRFERAKSRGWTEAEFARREAAQWPVEEKRRLADVVIPNRGSENELRTAILDFWNRVITPTQSTGS